MTLQAGLGAGGKRGSQLLVHEGSRQHCAACGSDHTVVTGKLVPSAEAFEAVVLGIRGGRLTLTELLSCLCG